MTFRNDLRRHLVDSSGHLEMKSAVTLVWASDIQKSALSLSPAPSDIQKWPHLSPSHQLGWTSREMTYAVTLSPALSDIQRNDLSCPPVTSFVEHLEKWSQLSPCQQLCRTSREMISTVTLSTALSDIQWNDLNCQPVINFVGHSEIRPLHVTSSVGHSEKRHQL